MKFDKKYLKSKIIEFQLKIAELKHTLTKQQSTFEEKEKELYLKLLEVLDAFENVGKTIDEKKENFDKTTRMLSKNVQSIQKKVSRIISAANIVKIEFPNNKAIMDYCKVLDTQNDPQIEDKTIISIVKNGYMNKHDGTVIRKAEVITNRQ